jgi:phage tail tape-measure protein
MTMNHDNRNLDAIRDPLTGAPGAHPVGTGVGGAAAGAATGTVAGPVGTVVGAAIGAVVGGLAGKGVAEDVNPTRERAYWSENFSGRDYVEKGSSFDDVESEMSSDWAASRGASSLSRERAKHAARDAWNRISPSS